MNRHYSMGFFKMNRRIFIQRLLEVCAMLAEVAIAKSLFPLGIFGQPAYANVSGRTNRVQSLKYRRLGKTKIMVSEISFGCALNYGCKPLGNKLDNVQNLYAKALDVGINLFDTSVNADAQYTDEECFQYFKPVRNKVFLCTKVNDLKPLETRTSIEKSLRRMNTDYIDVVFLHNIWRKGGWDKGLPALEEIRKMIWEGKVRFAGVSDHFYSNLMKIGKYKHLLDVILFKYSIKNNLRAEAVISEADFHDIGTIAIKVFDGAHKCWGEKSTKWQNDINLKPYLSKNTTVAQAAVGFVLNNPKLSSALIGMRSEAEITENVETSFKANNFIRVNRNSAATKIFKMIYKLINSP